MYNTFSSLSNAPHLVGFPRLVIRVQFALVALMNTLAGLDTLVQSAAKSGREQPSLLQRWS